MSKRKFEEEDPLLFPDSPLSSSTQSLLNLLNNREEDPLLRPECLSQPPSPLNQALLKVEPAISGYPKKVKTDIVIKKTPVDLSVDEWKIMKEICAHQLEELIDDFVSSHKDEDTSEDESGEDLDGNFGYQI